jgi:hypothetical protein
MICSMWRPTAAGAINRQTPRAKGAPNRANRPLGRSDWADRPRPFLGRFGLVFLPGCFLHDSLFVCTCMWAFDVISFMVKAWILAMQASMFSSWVSEDLHVHASVVRSFGVIFIACLDSCRASWSSLEVLDELIPKVSSLTLISCINNKLQNRHASVNLLQH